MIRIIGVKRLIILVVLLAFNGILASGLYLYVFPEGQKIESKQKAQRRKLSTLQKNISRMQIEFEQLDQQQGRFDKLKEEGFFSTQDRADAKEIFSLIQKQSGVISALVSVKPGNVVDDIEAKEAKHKVLVSDASVEIKAFDDNDVYHYIDLVQKTFPGVMSIQHISVHREKDISNALLRAIANGASPELVKANIEFLWSTMITEEQVLGATRIKR
ncbi:MAG: hypothetical protein KAJ29_06010 [Alphaproteobacteria bacterium]|nr:hypothetical protein [Alphaproteobacteria bacterium]